MQRSKVEVYLHMVWTTYRRAAFLSGALEEQVHSVIGKEAAYLGCKVYAVNGMSNHIHLVIRLHPTVSISKLAQRVKGGSSRFINEHFAVDEPFRWQERYGCFSFDASDLKTVVEYVRNQKQHHRTETVEPDWEQTEEEDPNCPDTLLV